MGFHEAWLKLRQVKPTAKAPATADSAITAALLRRLKTTSISDDEDEPDDSPDMIAKKHILRRRKNLRLIEKKKQEGEAKDLVTAPSDSLPLNRTLSNHHDLLSVHMFLMDLEEMSSAKIGALQSKCGSSASSRRARRRTPPFTSF